MTTGCGARGRWAADRRSDRRTSTTTTRCGASPNATNRTLFEFLTLEGAQAGLSWSTILRKVDGYRAAFADFDVETVAGFDDADVERCMADAGIVRNRGKITSTIGNARAWLELDDPVEFLWSFTGGSPLQNRWTAMDGLPAETDESRAMSKELKRRGFRFVGPDDLLRAHAGHRHGQRSPRRLLSARRVPGASLTTWPAQ